MKTAYRPSAEFLEVSIGIWARGNRENKVIDAWPPPTYV